MKRYFKALSIIIIFLGYTNAQEIVNTQSIISPPQVSRLGNATIALPIDLPNDVTSFKPELNLFYNSDGGSSWVGYGFSLGASSLIVDDRWGVPTFSTTVETELYSLDGMQLMYPENYLPHRHSGDEPSQFDTSFQDKTVGQRTVNNKIIKTFQPRKKTVFSKIERFGTSPKNYYWKVTHTNGTVQWFGGDENYQPTTNGGNDFIIRTNQNNIVEWALKKTVDRHGNFILYNYSKGNYSGLTGDNSNLNGGEYFYLDNIKYTGLQNSVGNQIREPKTHIIFEKSTNTNLRNDIIINAKSGAKKVDARKLQRITIKQKEKTVYKNVKSFLFNYETGQFNKTLLGSVTELNKSNQEIFKHKFDYYEMEGNIYNVNNYFIIDEKTTGVFQDVDVSIPLNIDQITGNAVLNRSKSTDWGWEVRGGLGLQIRPFILPSTGHSDRLFTFGATYGESYSNSIDLMGLIDVNGDGLTDIIFKDNDGIKFKPRINRTGSNLFGSIQSITSIGNIGITKGTNKTLFPSSLDFRSRWLSYGKKKFKNSSKNSVYLTDANADMLIDVVDFDSSGKSVVYFNHLNENGIPSFNPDSSLTPNMLITASPASEMEVENPVDVEEILESPNIMNHDAVICWTSFIKKMGTSDATLPFISDSIVFYPSEPESKLLYTIEFYDKSSETSSEIYSILFDNANPNTPNWAEFKIPHSLDYGDKLFFRVHKNLEGANDIIKSNPTIIFDNKATHDSHEHVVAVGNMGTSYAKDILLSKQGGFAITESSIISIDWDNLNIPNGTQPGNIVFTIKQIKLSTSGEEMSIQNLFSHSLTENGLNINAPANLSNISINLNEEEMVLLLFEVKSNEFIAMENNIGEGLPKWKPEIKFHSTNLKQYPVVSYENFIPIKLSRSSYADSDYLKLFTSLYFDNPVNTINGLELDIASTINNISNISNLSGEIRLVSGDAERKIVFREGSIAVLNMENQLVEEAIEVDEISDIALYADNVRDTKLLYEVRDQLCFKSKYKSNNIWYDSPNNSSCFFFKPNAFGKQSSNLGSNQMGWGQFFYNDGTTNIQPHELVNVQILEDPSGGNVQTFGFDSSNYDENSTVEDVENDLENSFNIPESGDEDEMNAFLESQGQNVNFQFPFLPATPIRYVSSINNALVETPRWQGMFDSQFFEPHFVRSGGIEDTSISQIFTEEESTTQYQPANSQTGMYGVVKESATKSKSSKSGLFTISHSKSNSIYSHAKTDFIDINGDGYPDRVLGNKVQYSTMTGGHGGVSTYTNINSYVSSSKNVVSGTSGSFSTSFFKSLNDFKSDVNKAANFVRGKSFGNYNTHNLQISASKATESQGNVSRIAIQGNANLSFDNNSLYETTLFDLDINGDGLLDKIYKNQNNTYSTFSIGLENSLTPFSGIKTMKSAPSALNFGIGVGGGLPSGDEVDDFPLIDAYDIINGGLINGIDLSQGISYIGQSAPSSIGFNFGYNIGIGASGSKVLVTYQDLNGDGLQDILYVGENKNAYVSYNLGNRFTSPVLISDNNTLSINLQNMSRALSGSVAVDADLYYGVPVFTLFIPIVFVPVPIFTIYFKSGLSGALYGSASMNDTRKSFMDFDGDGFVDYLKKEGDEIKIYPSQIKTTNKLKSVSSSLGKQFEVDYKLIGNTYDMPMGKWVMSDVYYFNGKTGNADFETEEAIHDVIEYENGYYDRRERQFYGYEKIATKRKKDENVLWSNINKFYNKSYYLNGLLKEQAIAKNDVDISNYVDCSSISNAHLFSCKSNNFKLKKITNGLIDINAGNLPEDYDTGGTEGRSIAGVELTSSIEQLFQFQSSPLITTTEYQSDEYGRTVRSELVEEGNISKYYYPDQNNQTALYNQYAISNPFRTESLKKVNGQEIMLAKTETVFDANTATQNFLLPIETKVSKGDNPTEIESRIELYDDNTNPLQTRDRFGVPTSIVYGYDKKLPILIVKGISYDTLNGLISIPTLQTKSNNDIDISTENALRTSLVNAINALNTTGNQIVEIKAFTYDENIGVTSEINMNKVITYYKYDSSNRLVEILDSERKIIKTFEYNTVGVTP